MYYEFGAPFSFGILFGAFQAFPWKSSLLSTDLYLCFSFPWLLKPLWSFAFLQGAVTSPRLPLEPSSPSCRPLDHEKLIHASFSWIGSSPRLKHLRWIPGSGFWCLALQSGLLQFQRYYLPSSIFSFPFCFQWLVEMFWHQHVSYVLQSSWLLMAELAVLQQLELLLQKALMAWWSRFAWAGQLLNGLHILFTIQPFSTPCSSSLACCLLLTRCWAPETSRYKRKSKEGWLWALSICLLSSGSQIQAELIPPTLLLPHALFVDRSWSRSSYSWQSIAFSCR